jgi:transposase-like protein
LVVVDGGKGLEAALASLWDDVPVQRCTVHKDRNLLAHAGRVAEVVEISGGGVGSEPC